MPKAKNQNRKVVRQSNKIGGRKHSDSVSQMTNAELKSFNGRGRDINKIQAEIHRRQSI